jgi:hypothetical protein
MNSRYSQFHLCPFCPYSRTRAHAQEPAKMSTYPGSTVPPFLTHAIGLLLQDIFLFHNYRVPPFAFLPLIVSKISVKNPAIHHQKCGINLGMWGTPWRNIIRRRWTNETGVTSCLLTVSELHYIKQSFSSSSYGTNLNKISAAIAANPTRVSGYISGCRKHCYWRYNYLFASDISVSYNFRVATILMQTLMQTLRSQLWVR